VFADTQQASPRQLRVHLLEPRRRRRRGDGGRGRRDDDDVDAVGGRVVVDALHQSVNVQAGVLSPSPLPRVLAQRRAQPLPQRGRDGLGYGVRRTDDGVTAQLDALQLGRLVPVDPDEQAATSLPRRQRDAVRRPQLCRSAAAAAARLRPETADADGQLHVDAAADDRTARHRVDDDAGGRQAVDIVRPEKADRPVDAAAVASHVHGRHVA